MTFSREEASFITVSYSDIFDYPLTKDELSYWLVFHKGEPDPKFLPKYSSSVQAIRKKREQYSMKKWRIVKKIAWVYKLIPTVQLVGVTGGLAMNNATNDDDIDLFFIVWPKTVWVSRFLATVVTEIIGKRRRPADTEFSDKICLNMFMTSDHLGLPKKEQDLFSAHEVLQMKPLWDRGVYQKFLHANSWVKYFLPNAWEEKVNSKWKIENRKTRVLLFTIYYLLEPIVKYMQLWYMKRHHTNEIISDTVIRFHPKDARIWVKEKLGRRLLRQNLPLDKIFYSH